MELMSLLPIPFMAAALIPAFLWYRYSISIYNIGIKCAVVLAYCALMLIVNRKSFRLVLQKWKQRKKGQNDATD